MASDLKLEIFAFKIFHKYLYDCGEIGNEPDVLEIYGDECAGDNSYLEACDESFMRAFYRRSDLLSDIYMTTISVEDIKDFTSLSEVSDFVNNMCDQDDLFGNLTVFERILATSEFALSICDLIHSANSGLKDVLKYSYIFWAMHFDKFADEFYKEGGWNKLKIVAKSYDLLYDMFQLLGIEFLWGSIQPLKEASLNYLHFKHCLKYLECDKITPQRKIGITQIWVIYRMQFFYSYIVIPLNNEECTDSYGLHLLLENLRFCCDPSLCHKIYGEETTQENSQESSLTVKANTFEHSFINDNALCNEFSDRLDSEKQLKKDCLISSKEAVDFDIAENVENIQLDNNLLTEMEMTQYIAPGVEMTEHSCPKQNSLPVSTTYIHNGECQKLRKVTDNCPSTLSVNKNEEIKIVEVFPRNVAEQSKIAVIGEVFPTNMNGEHECNRRTDPRSFCNLKDIGSPDECSSSEYDMINTKEKLEVNFYSKQEQIENSKTMNEESINQMTASKCDGKYAPDMLPKPKQLSLVNLCVDSGEKIERIQEAQEYLSYEQNDPEIKNFLRLILALGDKQGVKFVRLTLRSKEESTLKLQEKPNKKKKKKSKNKKLSK